MIKHYTFVIFVLFIINYYIKYFYYDNYKKEYIILSNIYYILLGFLFGLIIMEIGIYKSIKIVNIILCMYILTYILIMNICQIL